MVNTLELTAIIQLLNQGESENAAIQECEKDPNRIKKVTANIKPTIDKGTICVSFRVPEEYAETSCEVTFHFTDGRERTTFGLRSWIDSNAIIDKRFKRTFLLL